MIPKSPPRDSRSGFLYLPPYRLAGISVAGEQTVLHVPEFGVVFDMGQCTRSSLAANTIALSHPHMDHVGALPYWFSQRHFQKLEGGRCLCHPDTAGPLQKMLGSWIDLELQRTPHQIVPVAPNEEIPVRQNIVLRAIETRHTCPSLGWAIIEYRHKLKPEYVDLPQSRLRELREAGESITLVTEIPLVAYTGDTAPGAFLERDEFAKAKVLITECTFFDPSHQERAKVGKHLHFDDLSKLIPAWECEHIVVVHLSRRTLISAALERIQSLGADADRIHLLMDHRANRRRYDEQVAAVENKSVDSAGM
jgi:ribonuclease Z